MLYNSSNITVVNIKPYNTPQGTIKVANEQFVWYNQIDRIRLIRKGLPYATIEALSTKANIAVKYFLQLLDIPQTTYNKKKRDLDKLGGRDTEIVLMLIELIDYGVEVFNQAEDKFQKWLSKPNLSLGGETPQSYFDSLTGIQEVKKCLDRIEYGNYA